MDSIANTSDFIFYRGHDGNISVEVIIGDETVWLTQKSIADLFGVVKSTISEHFTNIFDSNELDRSATVRKIRTVQNEGGREVSRNLEFYNLDAIISDGRS